MWGPIPLPVFLRRPLRSGVGLMLASVIAGCALTEAGGGAGQLRSQNERLNRELEATKKQLSEQRQLLDAQEKRIETLLDLGSKRLEKLYYPTKIEIDRLSGGFDDDGRPGDDGVVVYLRPVDADGHTIKAAGQITIELFDLANPDGRHSMGKTRLDLEQARKAWYGRLWTHHYTVKCPWQKRTTPQHPEITVRVAFVDYLSGQTLNAQHVCSVRLPVSSPAP